MNHVIHKHACACPSCQRARFRVVCGACDRDITPAPFPRPAAPWWQSAMQRAEPVIAGFLMLVAVGFTLGADALLWFTFGSLFWLTAGVLCGLIWCVHHRSPWPMMAALTGLVALGAAAHLALWLARVGAAFVGGLG